MWKYKKIAPPFLFFEGQMYLDLTIFKVKPNTLVTKDIVTLTFNFAHTIYPQWCIMPL